MAHKYQAKKEERDGRTFHSKLEAALYDHLKLRERAGAITNLACQVHVRFHTYDHGKIHMIPDFYADVHGEGPAYFEAKGFFTRDWARKKKAWAVGGPAKLYVYGGSYKYLKHIETIIPGEKKCKKK